MFPCESYRHRMLHKDIQSSSVAQSCPTLCDPMNRSMPDLPAHHQLPEFTQTHVHWVGDTIQPSYPLLSPFSSRPQSFPASWSFQMSQLFPSGGQSIGASASTSVLPVNTQDWSPLGWTGWISLQSKGLSGVFSNTTVQKHPYSVSHWWVQQACIEHRADYIICKPSTVWKRGSQGWGCPAGSHLHVDIVERCWSLMTSAWKRWRWRWAEKEAESLSRVNN